MGFFRNTPIIESRPPPPQLVPYIGKRKVKTYNTDRSPCEPWLPACLAAGLTGCRNHVNNIIICHTHGVPTNSRNSICLCFHLEAQSGFVDLQISQPARAMAIYEDLECKLGGDRSGGLFVRSQPHYVESRAG